MFPYIHEFGNIGNKKNAKNAKKYYYTISYLKWYNKNRMIKIIWHEKYFGNKMETLETKKTPTQFI